MTPRELSILAADLLKVRHRINDHQIVDCLDIATLWRGTTHRITSEQLQAHWGVCPSVVSHRMKKLRKAGLIDYDRGCRTERGYLIWQLGPGLVQ